MKPKIVVISGPTASGKSEIAYRMAKHFGGEIVNADSVQVYRELKIGAAVPPEEWMEEVPHHLYGFVDLEVNFTAYDYMKIARKKIEEILSRGRLPIVVGGTGLYIRALLHGLFEQPERDEKIREKLKEREKLSPGSLYRELERVDPETARKLHPADLVRIVRALEVWYLTGERMSELQKRHAFADSPYNFLGIFLSWDRETLRRRIALRIEKMIEEGLIDEVREILKKHSKELKPLQSVGYREVILYLEGKIGDTEELKKKIFSSTWDLARRQIIWFRKEKGFYFLKPEEEEVNKRIEEFLRGNEVPAI